MDVELLRVEELTDSQIEAWQALAGQAVEPNPCFEPAFAVPALRHLDPDRAVRVLMITEGPDIRLCLPVVPRSRWKRLPVRAVASWHHAYSVLGTPLVDRTRVRPTLARLVDYLVRERRHPRLSVFQWIGDGPVLEVITQLRQPLMYSSFERPVLRRREDGDYLQVLRGRRRHQLAKRREQLEKELGEVRLVDRAHEAEARERFLELEQSGWKGEAGTAMASTPSHAAFFREMAGAFADLGRLELPSLETADGAVLAMAVRVLADGGVFQLKIAYNESYREFGPGRMLDLELLRTFHAHDDEQWVDSCTDPGNEFKASLFPERRRIDTVIVPADGRVNGIVARGVPRLRGWRNRFRGTD